MLPALARSLCTGVEELVGDHDTRPDRRGPAPTLLQQPEWLSALPTPKQRAATDCCEPTRAAGLAWSLAESVDDARLEALLFPSTAPRVERRAASDPVHLHHGLKHKDVTSILLWDEQPPCPLGSGVLDSVVSLRAPLSIAQGTVNRALIATKSVRRSVAARVARRRLYRDPTM